ncbi:hypothetical protein C8Q75DRAFT_869470 [Abortiporus biennis]|nr:hypothetical protein C8Q75DRAFT_869470 [Abortiporus biennis]
MADRTKKLYWNSKYSVQHATSWQGKAQRAFKASSFKLFIWIMNNKHSDAPRTPIYLHTTHFISTPLPLHFSLSKSFSEKSNLRASTGYMKCERKKELGHQPSRHQLETFEYGHWDRVHYHGMNCIVVPLDPLVRIDLVIKKFEPAPDEEAVRNSEVNQCNSTYKGHGTHDIEVVSARLFVPDLIEPMRMR